MGGGLRGVINAAGADPPIPALGRESALLRANLRAGKDGAGQL